MGIADKTVFLLAQLKALKFPVPETEYRFFPSRRWRFDIAWPKEKLACEIEGGIWIQGRHTRGVGYLGDLEKYNTATVEGWRLVRVTPKMITDGTALEWIEGLFRNQSK